MPQRLPGDRRAQGIVPCLDVEEGISGVPALPEGAAVFPVGFRGTSICTGTGYRIVVFVVVAVVPVANLGFVGWVRRIPHHVGRDGTIEGSKGQDGGIPEQGPVRFVAAADAVRC